MSLKNILIFFALIFSLSACLDEYWPDLDKYENLLVVDGVLTNKSNPTTIHLSLSSSISSEQLIPVNNGVVYLTDENQDIILFSEQEPGVYQVTDSTFQGQVGKSYQLHIELPNGKRYESDVCEMKAPSSIDSVYGIIENPDPFDNSQSFPGMQFYIENHSEVNDTSYYLFKVIHTYQYKSTFDIDYIWVGEFLAYPNPDSLRTCWRTAKANEILVSTSGLLDPTAINQFPLHFVSTESKLLSIRYSPLVRQLSISKAAYDFFSAVKEQSTKQENLWTTQPFQILGNIHNVDNKSEPVLGYFVVAGASEKRIFVNKPPLTFYYEVCEPDFESLRFIESEPRSRWPIYIDDIMFLGWAMADSKACFDCRLEGGSITPPHFWVDE